MILNILTRKTTENNLEWLSNTAMKYALAEDVEIVYPAGTFTAKFKQVLDGIREYVKSLLKGSKEVVSMVQSGEFTQDFIEELKKGASGELPALYVENKAKDVEVVQEADQKVEESADKVEQLEEQDKEIVNPYLRMPIERVQADADNGVVLAQEALSERKEEVQPEVETQPQEEVPATVTEAKIAVDENIIDNLTPMQKGRINKLLDKQISNNGNSTTWRDLINSGKYIRKEKEEVAKIEYNRRKYNRMDWDEQRVYNQKLKEKKTEYRLYTDDDIYLKIPKTLFDVIGISQPQAETEAQTETVEEDSNLEKVLYQDGLDPLLTGKEKKLVDVINRHYKLLKYLDKYPSASSEKYAKEQIRYEKGKLKTLREKLEKAKIAYDKDQADLAEIREQQKQTAQEQPAVAEPTATSEEAERKELTELQKESETLDNKSLALNVKGKAWSKNFEAKRKIDARIDMIKSNIAGRKNRIRQEKEFTENREKIVEPTKSETRDAQQAGKQSPTKELSVQKKFIIETVEDLIKEEAKNRVTPNQPTKILIHVPDDGKYLLPNTEGALKAFLTNAKRMSPETLKPVIKPLSGKPAKPTNTTKVATKPLTVADIKKIVEPFTSDDPTIKQLFKPIYDKASNTIYGTNGRVLTIVKAPANPNAKGLNVDESLTYKVNENIVSAYNKQTNYTIQFDITPALQKLVTAKAVWKGGEKDTFAYVDLFLGTDGEIGIGTEAKGFQKVKNSDNNKFKTVDGTASYLSENAKNGNYVGKVSLQYFMDALDAQANAGNKTITLGEAVNHKGIYNIVGNKKNVNTYLMPVSNDKQQAGDYYNDIMNPPTAEEVKNITKKEEKLQEKEEQKPKEETATEEKPNEEVQQLKDLIYTTEKQIEVYQDSLEHAIKRNETGRIVYLNKGLERDRLTLVNANEELAKLEPATEPTKTATEAQQSTKATQAKATEPTPKEKDTKPIDKKLSYMTLDMEDEFRSYKGIPYRIKTDNTASTTKSKNFYAVSPRNFDIMYGSTPALAEERARKHIDKYIAKPAVEEEASEAVVAKKSTDKLTHFGDKLGGSRADMAESRRLFNAIDKDIDRQDILNKPLSKLIPKPNYRELIDAGMDKGTAEFIKIYRDQLPAKGRTSYKNGKYADSVEAYIKFLRWAKEITGAELVEKMREMGSIRMANDMQSRMDLLDAVGFPEVEYDTKKNYLTHSELIVNDENGKHKIDENGKLVTKPNWRVGNLRGQETQEEAIQKFKEYLGTQQGKSQDKRKLKLDIYRRRDKKTWIVGKKLNSRTAVDIESGFETTADARKYLAENYDEIVKRYKEQRKIPAFRTNTTQTRVGEDYRNGKDVTPEMFTDTFGFRGVEFGKWVDNIQRHEELNDAYDGLMDLANLLEIPPNAISLNGELGLGFGSRGSGNASAHYEPSTVVINLTKTKGSGSLAHEWFHALDGYFARSMGQRYSYTSETRSFKGKGGNTTIQTKEGYKSIEGLIRPEILSAFENIRETIYKKTAMYKRSGLVAPGSDYWSSTREVTARAFENYLIDKLAKKGYSSEYLANVIPQDSESLKGTNWADERYPYLLLNEIPAVAEAYDNLFKTVKYRKTERGTETYNLQPTSRRALSYIKQFDKVNEQQKVFERYGANEYIQQAQDLKDSIVKDIERITDTKAGKDQIDYIRQVKQDANMNAYEKREMEKKPRTIKNITEDLKSIRRKFNEKGYKKGGEAIRKEIVKLQKELEPYLAMLPAEQRGKMFKRTRMLAERKTPAGQLKLLNQTIEKVEAMVDAINRQGAMNIFDNYFEYLHPKTNKKGILVNKSLTQETLERIQKIETLSMLTPEAYNKALSELEYPENPQEQIDKELLLMFGNIQDKSTSDLINSANEFEAIVKDGLEERRKIAEERARKVQELRDLVDNGVRSGKKQLSDEALKQKRKQLLTKINNGLKGYADSHIAFELLMNQLGEKVRNEFGLREHEAMTLENKIIRERRMEFNDYLRKLFKGNQFKSALAYRNFIKEVDSDIEVFQSTKEKQKLTIDDAFELVRQYNDGEVSEKFADIYLDDDVIKDINERLSALKRTQTGEINANQKYIKFTTNEYSQPKSLKLSQAQAVHYYLASFQHTYRNNMLNNGWTNESFTELENFMTDEAYQFADWILKKNKGNYKPLNDVYKGINHVDLSNTENYAKVKVDHGEKSTIVKDNLEKSMLGFRQGGKKSLSNSSLIQRVEHGHSPDQVSALDLYMQAVYEDAHYIAYAELAEDLNAVFKSKQVKEAIDSSTNEKFNKEIDTAIDNIVTGGNGWGYSKYLEKFKNFTSLYYLAWKAINFPKQLMSFGAGWGRMPTNKFIEYTAKFYNYKKFKENYKWTMEQDYIQNRMRMGFTQAQQGMYAEILNNPAYIGIAAMKLGMSFTRYGDIFPTMQTYHASYNYWMNELKGIPKAEAERRATQEAISACELTQQPMGKAGRGTIQDTFGTLGRFAQMFQSAQRIYFGNTYAALLDMANKKEGSKKQFAKMFFIYQVLMPILFMGVGDLFDALTDDDWEFEPLDYVFAIVASPLSGLFITAPVSNFVIREALGLNASSISFTGGAGGVIEAIGRAVGDITEGDWEEALLKLTKESGAGDTVKRINQIMD